MAAKSNRISVTIPVGGGMATPGDTAKLPPDTSEKIKNMFVMPGPRVEKRPGWAREASLPPLNANPDGSTAWGRLFRYVDDVGIETLIAGGISTATLGGAYYRSGAWATSSFSWYTSDSANYLGKAWLINSVDLPTIGKIRSFDGTTTDDNPTKTALTGGTICVFNHRAFVGAVRESPTDLAGARNYEFETAGVWTLGGGPPTVAVVETSVRRMTIVGATDTAKTTVKLMTTGATTEYVTIYVQMRSNEAAKDMPLTATVENAAGTVYGSLPILVVKKSILPDWQTFVLTARVPAATDVFVKYIPGNLTLAAVAGTVDIGDSATGMGFHFTTGRRVYDVASLVSVASLGHSYPYRFAWCEVNDPTAWLATSYYDCKEVAGPITVIRATLAGQLLVFKSEAIWLFNAQDNANLPVAFQQILHNVGCVNPSAILEFEGMLYFIGQNEVYRWSGSGTPEPLALPTRMRETLFPATSGYPLLAIDTDRRVMYCHTQTGKIHVYSLDSGAWSYITLTGAADAELGLNSMIYMRPTGETSRELWVSVGLSPNIVKLRAAQTQDNITGTVRDVTAEYWFRPMQTQSPKQDFFLEEMEIDHRITADQTGSATTLQTSADGGATFDKAVTVTVAPLASGGYQPMRMMVQRSDHRITIAVKHVGLAGPAYFNFSGGVATAQILGNRFQPTNPTPVSSNL